MTTTPTDEPVGSPATSVASAASDTPAAPAPEPAVGLRDELPLAGRKALVTLLTHRFVSRSRQQEAWAGLLAYEPEIRARLAEMFLVLEVDHGYEVAFKRQSGQDDVPVLLRREKPLSRDATLLLVFLRREHAYTDAADEAVVVSRDQVAEFLSRFHDDAAHDELRSARRVDAAIAAMVARDLLIPESDDPTLFVVAPAVVPLVTPDRLVQIEAMFLEAGRDVDPEGDPGDLGDGTDLDGPTRASSSPDDLDDPAGPASEAADTTDDAPTPDPTAVTLDLDAPEDDRA